MNSESSESEMSCTPPNIKEKAGIAISELIPRKSKAVYENCYKKFMEWKKTHKVSSLSEDVIISYLSDLSSTMKPSTLWSQYSMLKAYCSNCTITLNINYCSKQNNC